MCRRVRGEGEDVAGFEIAKDLLVGDEDILLAPDRDHPAAGELGHPAKQVQFRQQVLADPGSEALVGGREQGRDARRGWSSSPSR